MRNVKISFAFVIAILAVGLTIASKASTFGSRAVTACFQVAPLSDYDPLGATNYTPAQTDDCSFANSQINTLGIKWLTSQPSVISIDCLESAAKFCCVKFDVDNVNAPEDAPVLTIGSQTGKFKVVQILCRVQ